MFILFLLTSLLKSLKNTKNSERVEGLSKIKFKELLSLATKKSCFIFNEKFCKQVDGVILSSPLGPTLANIFLVYL